MGLIDRLFGTSNEVIETNKFPWIPLTNSEQIENIEVRSKDKIQVIFKYSTRCGINRIVMKKFEKAYESFVQYFDFYYLDILAFRTVSNTIATKYHIIHESPQVLVIKNGAVIAHSSHSAINQLDLSAVL